MEDVRQSRRVTIRLTPWQARRLWELRIAGVPEGQRPRTATEVLLRAVVESKSAHNGDDLSAHGMSQDDLEGAEATH